MRNKLGIIDPKDLEAAENKAYICAFEKAIKTYEEDQTFTAKDVCDLNRLFLGDIYEWAGTYRTVDLSSADIRWCHAQYIPKEMQRIDKLLRSLTPFHPRLSKEEVINGLAEIHGELIVIHPFRDGNGRTTRLLGNLLLIQAGYQPVRMVSFNAADLISKYHTAIRDVWIKADYRKLKRFLDPLIQKHSV